jgi:hypothetical protein
VIRRLTVIAALLALVAAVVPGLRADATTTERPVSRPRYEPARFDQKDPAIASGSSSSLVVWSDERGGESNNDIYATRVDRDGTVLDRSGVPISRARTEQVSPDVAFNGTDYLVVWQRNGNFGEDVFGRRVHADGRPAGPVFAVSPPSSFGGEPAVTSDGTSWFVAWSGGTGDDIYATRVTRTGAVVQPGGVAVTTARFRQSAPAVAVTTARFRQSAPAITFDGRNVVIAWQDFRNGRDEDLYAARLTPAGAVLDPDGIAVSTEAEEQRAPAVATIGSTSFIVWDDGRTHEPQNDIYGARLDRNGSVLDPDGKVLGTGSTHQNTPGIAANGTSYLVTWLDNDLDFAVVGKPFDAAGDALAPAYRLGQVFFDLHSAVAATGNDFFTVWSGLRDVLGQRSSTEERVGGALTVSLSATEQSNADLAFDGTNHLVAWNEGGGVYAARIGPDGRSLDPEGIRVSGADGRDPAVAYDGTRYVVAWVGGSVGGAGVRVTRVSTSGRVLDPGGIRVSTADEVSGPPDLAVVGGRLLVVWSESSSFGDSDVWGARLDGAGHVVGPFHVASGSSYSFAGPAIASSGTQALVVWTDDSLAIRGRRVTGSGVLDSAAGFAVSTGESFATEPSVAFDRARYLVVWTSLGRRAGSFDIFATRVATTGRVLDPGGIPITTAPGDQEQADVTADGPFLVAWRDDREDRATDVAVTTVSGAGTVARRGGRRVTGSPEHDGSPAVAGAARSGRFRLAWEHFVPGPPYGTVRVFTEGLAPT